DENIFDVLQLFDYLCVDLFPSPLLDEPNLRSLNPTDRNRRLFYRPVKNVGEVRTLAAEFVLSLSRDEYDLNDFRTIESVFTLISVIFTRRDIFNSQFRYHTYTILDKCVFPLFFKRHPMEVLINIDEYEKMELYDDLQSIPIEFQGAFCRKGTYELIEAKSTNRKYQEYTDLILSRFLDRIEDQCRLLAKALHSIFSDFTIPNVRWSSTTESVPKELYSNKTQSRSFCRLPKQSAVNQLKPKYGRKAQKFR
ncbi:unnamed protein product, partial [Adineta ricciae]